MNNCTRILPFLLLLCVVFSCSRDLDVPEINEISKQDREVIGDFLDRAILYNAEEYPLIVRDSRTSPSYFYLQALYDQVTHSLRADFTSFSNNRWTPDRTWEVHVFSSPEQVAFSIPGGGIYLSDQLLKSLSSVAEIYYILSMEALIVQNDLLFKALIAEYSTKTLKEIGTTGTTSDNRVEGIETFLPLINYQLQDDLSQMIADHVCRTSRYDPNVILNIKANLSPISQWISTRPLRTLEQELEVCGDEMNEADYKYFILDRL